METCSRNLRKIKPKIGNARCHNGDCVLASQRCDKKQDCSDLSDEIHCGKFSKKNRFEFFSFIQLT